jgi:leader peptidase (prepilin peptidase)/N-methyltransferase
MSLTFPLAAAAVAAACGWPAANLIAAYSAAGAGPAGPALRSARPLAAWLTGLITTALVVAVTLRLNQVLTASACAWLVLCGVPLAAIDARARRLPDALTGACFAGTALLLMAAAAAAGQWQDLARAGAGAAAVALFFALIALARPGAAGLGDAKLGLSTGAITAWFGWGILLSSVFGAFLLAGCYGLGLLVADRASLRGSSVPFGPFLLAGCLAVVLLAGPPIRG